MEARGPMKDLFGNDKAWKDHWVDMPEYDNVEQRPPTITATFKFESLGDYEQFIALITEYVYDGQKPFDGMQRKNTKSTWFPHKDKPSKYLYVNEAEVSDIHNK
jgi:hypothetical protein